MIKFRNSAKAGRDEAAEPDAAAPEKVGRRRILGRIGALGLMTSAGVFAATQEASAAPLCCSLANYPANTTYTWCYNHKTYIWYCSVNGSLHCSCCEADNDRYSAADCRYN
ncbi:hypothetical protein [Yinghuangia seranimata]|uniref:hypothetical protein n=1 Tax=Yinghuangia seranimata TaxID=408067 RepID=UPI00248BCB13|nr:hypothetical protein [Yinghuangia seranimata]MDI2131065.1 hypothetical protein [Yinghuangia seranimata]